MNLAIKLLPLGIFLTLAAFLGIGLTLDPSKLPSALIDKPAPEIIAESLHETDAPFDSQSMLGEVWVLNVWASWCAPCVQEHPVLKSLVAQRDISLVGLNYKDVPEDALAWLQQLGDPFNHLISDESGDIGIDWGVYGVPETFVIDRNGRVRYKHVGPLAPIEMEEIVLPIIDQLKQEPA